LKFSMLLFASLSISIFVLYKQHKYPMGVCCNGFPSCLEVDNLVGNECRNRLSYEQFSAFLANIKELNAHRQTREVMSYTMDLFVFSQFDQGMFTLLSTRDQMRKAFVCTAALQLCKPNV
jgi:hypothetical protein